MVKYAEKYCTDGLMKQTWFHLLEDFRTTLGVNFGRDAEDVFLRSGIKGFRNYEFPGRMQASVAIHKRDYQLESLFKRYRFNDELLTDKDLTAMALDKFAKTQERVAAPITVDTVTYRVMQEARRIIKSILGEFSPEELKSKVKFGKRACVGTPYSESYLDVKMTRGRITGSNAHVRWFQEYLTSDKLLEEVIQQSQKRSDIEYTYVSALSLATVPKSFKAKRTILANTLLGSFYTAALGRLIQARLLKVGLDITILQEKHGEWARVGSEHGRLVTADLSAASDSISSTLLKRVLPLPWFRAVMFGSIPYVKVGDSLLQMSSVITMGMGHTFPLQTLVFYALLKAIGNLKQKRTFVSVYGDDLIYSRHLHREVEIVFPRLHLLLNKDKTYVYQCFRESCGSDFYRGYDVRPAQPDGQHRRLAGAPFKSFVYKLYNSLIERWQPGEIRGTLSYLLSRIIATGSKIYRVPHSFPADSGIKTATPEEDLGLLTEDLEPILCEPPNNTWVFKFLMVQPVYRAVPTTFPYYWEKLRASSTNEAEKPPVYEELDDSLLLVWRKMKFPPKGYFSKGEKRWWRDHKGKKRRITPLKPFVVEKGPGGKLVSKAGLTVCWL